jgi:serine/threonine-protein kinase
VVYVARHGARTQLYFRPLDQIEPIPIPGSEGAGDPFLSPDGDWVGFFADGALKKVPVTGGAPVTLCEADRGGSATWGVDGTIFFAPGGEGGLWRVPAAGGKPESVRIGGLPGRTSLLWPDLLPGGAALLFTLGQRGNSDAAGIATVVMATGEVQAVIDRECCARYASSGHLVFAHAGTLLAAPFDPVRRTITGKPVPVVEGVLFDPGTGAVQFGLSANGTLVYVPAEPALDERTLVSVDRHGTAAPLTEEKRAFDLPRWAPDGRRVAVTIPEGGKLGIWVHDLEDRSWKKLPFEASSGLPLWAPRGTSLTFVSPRAGGWNLFRFRLDHGGDPELLWTSEYPLSPSSWSADGRQLALTQVNPESRGDILILAAGENARPKPWKNTRHNEWGAVFSPGGRTIAYTSDQSGRDEVYVEPYAGAGESRRVSTDGGYGAAWTQHGRELVYRSGDAVMALAITDHPGLSAGRPWKLFAGRYQGPSAGWPGYDVTSDGRRFVMIRRKEEAEGPTQLYVVQGWFEELRRLVARGQE